MKLRQINLKIRQLEDGLHDISGSITAVKDLNSREYQCMMEALNYLKDEQNLLEIMQMAEDRESEFMQKLKEDEMIIKMDVLADDPNGFSTDSVTGYTYAKNGGEILYGRCLIGDDRNLPEEVVNRIYTDIKIGCFDKEAITSDDIRERALELEALLGRELAGRYGLTDDINDAINNMTKEQRNQINLLVNKSIEIDSVIENGIQNRNKSINKDEIDEHDRD